MDSDVRKSVSNTDALLVCMLRCKGQPNSPRFPHPDKTVGLGGIPARYPRGILAGAEAVYLKKFSITGPLKVYKLLITIEIAHVSSFPNVKVNLCTIPFI